jgi:protein required for attachment to host cells
MAQTRKTSWILVCDASRARLLRAASPKNRLVQLEAYDHAESRARARDLMADANGRKPVGPVPASAGHGQQGTAHGRPGAEPDTDPKEVEAQKFARQLAEVLERGLHDHAYDRLFLVAPPHFLGLLRGTVSAQVKKQIEGTIDKDLTHEDLDDLSKRLEADLSGG